MKEIIRIKLHELEPYELAFIFDSLFKMSHSAFIIGFLTSELIDNDLVIYKVD